LTIARVVAGGDGLGRAADGRVVFVPAALPGERVRIALVDERADFARGRLLDVLDASPDRQAPPCPFVAAGCGGCGWQHVAPAAQVELKLGIVKEALARTGGMPEAVVAPGPALPDRGFRTTVRLAVDPDGRLGFRVRRGHDMVPIDACLVAHPLLAELLATPVPGADEVTLRCGANTGERLAFIEPRRVAAPVGWPSDVRVGAHAHIHEVVAGHHFRISARSFFQTRVDGAEALVAAVRDAVDGEARGRRVVDAYAGVGLFAATVDGASSIVAVERAPSAVFDARHNVPGLRVVEADVARWKPSAAEVVIADPSRDGLGRAAVKVLAGCGARRMVLVSCDPVSLARDAKLLAGLGYEHVRSVVIDLFPHTPHIETVSRFDRR
jgi:23S rRNA (uracil1939-C5)-methyltransferase